MSSRFHECPEADEKANATDRRSTSAPSEACQPRRAIGYAIVVDGRFKAEFDDEKAAERAAAELLARYPMLKVEVYDATSKSRTLVR
jgi:hypothetical protein